MQQRSLLLALGFALATTACEADKETNAGTGAGTNGGGETGGAEHAADQTTDPAMTGNDDLVGLVDLVALRLQYVVQE